MFDNIEIYISCMSLFGKKLYMISCILATEKPGNPQLDYDTLSVTDKLRADPSFVQIQWQIQGLMECRIRVRTLTLA